MSKEIKELVADLWRSGFKKEAHSLARLHVAKGITNENRDLQYRIFSQVLSDLGAGDANLVIDMKKSVAQFDVKNMSLVQFPKFLERLLRGLNETGTKDYTLDHIDRKDPMRVFIKI